MASPDGAGRRRIPRASAPETGSGRPGDPVVRVLLGATGVLAAVAAILVVVSEDGRLLRLGVVAGLWAALLAVAALARRSGGGAEAGERELESMRRTYELELQAEIDARREHELTVEQSVRRELAEARGDEIAGLRAEIERLRTHLENAETHAVPPQLAVVAPDDRGAPRPYHPGHRRPGPRGPGPAEGSQPSLPGDGRPLRPVAEGRTVAELLAAHAAEDRRRPPRAPSTRW